MSKIVYRIKRSDGMYSCGGEFPSFSERGKTWTNIGGLKNHLNHVLNKVWAQEYKECVIEKYEIFETLKNSGKEVDGIELP